MLKLENVSVKYGKLVALRNVSLSVNKGESVSIVGRNGAGKTTLLKTIVGLVRNFEGKIFFEEIELSKLPPWKRASLGIGFVPEGRRLFPYLTVEENLVVAGYLLDKDKLRDRMEKVFSLFPRLKERRKQLAFTLSGGEAQMLAIARGLINDPKLLLMDEPSQGLAPIIVDEVFSTINRLSEEGYSILIVEQNTKKAFEVSDRVYVLDSGQIVYEGTSAEAMRDPRIKKAYLGE